jgi:hypothetical protein
MGMVASNEIPFTRIGERNLRFPVDGLRQWVAQRSTWPTSMSVPTGPEQSTVTSGIPAGANGRAANGAVKAAVADGVAAEGRR